VTGRSHVKSMQTSLVDSALVETQVEPAVPPHQQQGVEYFEPHWYAAYTCANHEKSVTQKLQQRSVEFFLPLYESVRRWQDRRVRLELPLFPGYVFVRLSLRNRLQVLEIPGIVRLVGFNGHPTPLPTEDIEMIRSCFDRRHPLKPHSYVQRGQRVRVLSGPLEGLTGMVVRQRNRTRFVISLELLMRSVAVDVDVADVVLLSMPRATKVAQVAL
jgi:transcription antitermination factor NusG